MKGLTSSRASRAQRTVEPNDGHGCSRLDWESDVALEIWIDTKRVPVTLRLVGTIGRATGARLVTVVAELIADGYNDFELCSAAVDVVEPAGDDALLSVQRLISRSGGRLIWNSGTSSTLN
jgi:hypothetical protein